MNKRVWIARVASVALATAFVAWWSAGWARFDGPINALGVDFAKPAAYIGSASLSALPRDLARSPVLRDLLSEDFVFYYEDQEDRLNLRGTLKRLAFEHDPAFSDTLLDVALDEPADLAFWTDAKNAPRHWALAMTRGTLAKALQALATVATKDKQLTLIGELRLDKLSVASQPVYALTLSSRRTLAITTRGNRVVVLSDPGLLFDAQRHPDPEAVRVLAELLSGDSAEQSPWRRHFNVVAPASGHTLVASSALLAFGWQHFFPSLQALRVDVAAGGATLRTALRQTAAPTSSVGPWTALPAQPAACARLPVDWARARDVLGPSAKASGTANQALAAMLRSVDGSAAVCVYARSQLHTPLLVAHASGPAPDAAVLQAFMAWWMPRSAVVERGPGNGAQAMVAARWGSLKVGDDSAYQPTLRREGDWWLFSPDPALVALAADTVARRFPSVADSLGGTPGDIAATFAVAAPEHMADLARRETLAVLTPQQAAFRQAAEQQLWPRLAAFARSGAVHAVLTGPADARGWTALEWRAMKPAAR
jgi:uncharacterized protein YfaA (DUF2138 family)